MTKLDNFSNLFKFIFFMSNINMLECCVCCEIPERLYIICKPNCTKYSYCKKCIDNIERLYHRCPFTNTYFSINDIGLDHRNNESLEIYKKYNKNNIKNINCNILFDKS